VEEVRAVLDQRAVRSWLTAGRDRCVDAGVVAVGAGAGVASLLATLADGPAGDRPSLARELTVGLLGCLVLLLRRRRPIGVAVALILAGLASSVAFGASFVALYAVAVRRPGRTAAAMAALQLAPVVVFYGQSASTGQYVQGIIGVALVDAVLVVSGMLVRSQRLLVRSLQERARQAEEGQRLRIEDARRLERERIAREMHDVLAHRISLLAVHAGALEYRPDAPTAQVSRAAGVIRSCAYQALEDLREVIGVLRTGGTAADTGAGPEPPQPTLADLAGLLDEARRTGQPVTLDERLAGSAGVPAGVGRHAYRIVQEGLTNARKHAAGAPERVLLAGDAGGDLVVELTNPLPAAVRPAGPAAARAAALPGAGAGLIGLAERAELVGGRLEFGPTPGGDFRLRARLPWPA
jgi:signal transduction histidine kinase